MKFRLTNPKLLLTITVVLLLFMCFLPVRFARVTWVPEHLVTALCTPASDVVKRISDKLGRPRSDAPSEDLEKVREDRDRLLSYSRQLEQELEKANQTIQQFTQVGQRLQLKGSRFLVAEVTAYSDAGRNPVLIINRGQNAGIQKGWIVTSGPNLVGWVAASPGPVTSTVRLITAPKTPLIVQVLPQVAGPAPQREPIYIEAAANGQEFWNVFDIRCAEQFSVGDVAYLKDPNFPPEAAASVVGRVFSIAKDPADPILRRILVIRPVQSLRYLSQVTVIVPPGVPQKPE